MPAHVEAAVGRRRPPDCPQRGDRPPAQVVGQRIAAGYPASAGSAVGAASRRARCGASRSGVDRRTRSRTTRFWTRLSGHGLLPRRRHPRCERPGGLRALRRLAQVRQILVLVTRGCRAGSGWVGYMTTALRMALGSTDPRAAASAPPAVAGSPRVPSFVCSSVTTAPLPTRVRSFPGSASSVPTAPRLVRCSPVGFRIRPLHPVR